MSRFNPRPGEPYAHCTNCEKVLTNPAEMSAHLSETFTNGKSHRAQITNLTRDERIERELSQLADDALSEFVDQAMELTEREDVTEAEVTEALRTVVGDFEDAWAKRGE